MIYDLHVHSNLSDGKLSKDNIYQKAIDKGLEYLAFTDHNDFSVFNGYCDDLRIINGIEFDVRIDPTSFHMLFYFSNFNNSIEELIREYKSNIKITSEMLINNIKKVYNIDISYEKVAELAHKDWISKRDIIDWLLLNNYADNVHDAANRFTNKNAPSYVQKYSLNCKDVMDVASLVNAKTILAHPNKLKLNDKELFEFIKYLKSLGLDGVEIYNSSVMNSIDAMKYKKITEELGLLSTSGSDFHTESLHSVGVDNNYSDAFIKCLKQNGILKY